MCFTTFTIFAYYVIKHHVMLLNIRKANLLSFDSQQRTLPSKHGGSMWLLSYQLWGEAVKRGTEWNEFPNHNKRKSNKSQNNKHPGFKISPKHDCAVLYCCAGCDVLCCAMLVENMQCLVRTHMDLSGLDWGWLDLASHVARIRIFKRNLVNIFKNVVLHCNVM